MFCAKKQWEVTVYTTAYMNGVRFLNGPLDIHVQDYIIRTLAARLERNTPIKTEDLSTSENSTARENSNARETPPARENSPARETPPARENSPARENRPARETPPAIEIEVIPLAIKLIDGIKYIKGWLENKKLSAVTTPYNFENTTKAYNTEIAKKYLIELFSIDRTERLSCMIKHLYFDVSGSHKLVKSLAVVVTWSFGIPEERETDEFQNIESLLVNALSTPRDSFTFDFVLYTLLGQDLEKTDVVIAINTVDRKPIIDYGPFGINSEAILDFMESPFMRKQVKMRDPRSFSRCSRKVRSGILCMLLGRDLKEKKIKSFNEIANIVLNYLNMLHSQIRVLDGKAHTASSPLSDDSNIIPAYVNESSIDIVAEYNTMISQETATFADDVVSRRMNRNDIRRKIELLMSPGNLYLFTRKRNNPDAFPRLTRIQRSFGNLVFNLKDYERYIYEYEKRFVLGRVFKICDLFKLELLKVKARGDVREVGMLKCLKVQATTTVWCLDQVYRKFLASDNSYSRDGYMHHIKMLSQSVLGVDEDNIETENANP
ncbi:hypothetical protein MFLAVUS_004193 [Mucor flavus]|uniref:Uncharacterized protein n=1 Tax=Mucor flavus TaxID=439312 RepID=A0ABP9YV86_9FUNG